MSRLPTLSARKLIAALKRAGFVEDGQDGSHLYLTHPLERRITCIPIHGSKDIRRSLLRLILKQAGLSEDDLSKLL